MISKQRVVLIAALLVVAFSIFGSATAAVHHVPSYGGGGHGGGHGGHDGGHGGGHGGYYGGYYPYYGYGYGYYGYYGPYPYDYGYYGYYGPYAYGSPYPAGEPDYGIIDCDVDPEEAKVYLDGERLGEADDFDGFPQFLTVPTGHHVVEFRRHGFQTLRLEMEVKPGHYYDIDRKMHAGDINGKPWIEYWGTKPHAQEPEDDADAPPAPPPPRTHHYNEKPKAPKPSDPNQGDPSDDAGSPEPAKAEAGSPPPRP